MTKYQHRRHTGELIDLATGKAICVGQNYADHVQEMAAVFDDTRAPKSEKIKPVLFMKPSSALCSAQQDIRISHLAHLGAMHNELEIALLIGHPLDSHSRNHLDAIHGIGLALDLTLREVQTDLKKRGLPWERAKSFDGSCPVSAFIPFSNSNPTLDLNNIDIQLRVNGQLRQKGNSSMMLTPIKTLLTEITTLFSLQPGDIVLTGTPAGVGALHAGDVIDATLNQTNLIQASKLS